MPSFSTILALLFFTITIATAGGKEFQVGNDVGWRIPASNETDLYNVWAERRSFHIGDSLRFHYNNDSVVWTVKWAYHHCDARQPITVFDDGNTVVNLDKVGRFFFISGKADRCNKGQKMIVNVKALPISSPFVGTLAPEPAPAQLSGSGSSGAGLAVSVSVFVVSFIVAVAGLYGCA